MFVPFVTAGLLACADRSADACLELAADTASHIAEQPPEAPSFRGDVYPTYLSYCSDCHAAWGGTDPDAVYDWVMTESHGGASLVVAGDHERSLLWSKLAEDPPLAGAVMPPQLPAYSDSDLLAVRGWIEGGAENDDTFRPVAQQYLRYGCDDCHSEWQDDLYRSLTTSSSGVGALPFIVPGAPDESLYYQKIASDRPPIGVRMPIVYPLLPTQTTDRIAAWIEAGADDD